SRKPTSTSHPLSMSMERGPGGEDRSSSLSPLLDTALANVLIAANALAESLADPESIDAKDLAARANAANAMANMATRLHQIKLAEQAAHPAPEPEIDPDAPIYILEIDHAPSNPSRTAANNETAAGDQIPSSPI